MLYTLLAPVRAMGDITVQLLDKFCLLWLDLRFGVHPDIELLVEDL